MPHSESVLPLGVPIAPTEPTDLNPTHIAEYGRGGLHSVATIADRNAISADRKKVGMLVYVEEDANYYRLSALPSTWEVLALPTSSVVTTVRNSTGSTIPKGSAVRISGSTGNRPNVVLAQANNYSNAEAIGVVPIDIPNNSDGLVVEIGIVDNLNTSAFNAGDILYLSSTVPGGLTAVEPTKPNWQVQIGIVTWANPANGRIVVNRRVESTKTEYISDMTATGTALATAADQAAARTALGLGSLATRSDVRQSEVAWDQFEKAATKKLIRTLYMDGSDHGEFAFSLSTGAQPNQGVITYGSEAVLTTVPNRTNARAVIRDSDFLAGSPTTRIRLTDYPLEFFARARYDGSALSNNHAFVGFFVTHSVNNQNLAAFVCNGTANWQAVVQDNYGTPLFSQDTGIPVANYADLSIDYSTETSSFSFRINQSAYIGSYTLTSPFSDDGKLAYAGAEIRQRVSGAAANLYVSRMYLREYLGVSLDTISDEVKDYIVAMAAAL